MKKIMMTLAAVAVAATMNAQVYVGGTLSFKTADVMVGADKESTTSFIINPEIGYVLDDNWSVGISFGFGSTNLATSDVVNYGGVVSAPTTTTKLSDNYTMFAINPYARYTFAKLSMVNFFVDGGLNYTNLNTGSVKVNSFGVNFQPGVAVNLNEKVSFVAKLGKVGYTSSKGDWDGAEAFGEFDFTLSSLAALQFGMYYNF
ncbi:MAG: outer membrane beta-barrel protein [Prevotella sp.]|nr:outer membrane beta-barrel protein [Prevotella sp.]